MNDTSVLSSHVAEVVERLVGSGRFASREDVLREGVDLLEDREAALADLDSALAAGIRSADAGALTPGDAVFDRLLAKYGTMAPAAR